VSVVICTDEHDEARMVVREVTRAMAEGHSLDQVAVFYRTHAQSRVIEDQLVRSGVPYQVLGGPRFYERAEVKDLMSYLRVVANPADREAFTRAAASPKRGLGPAALAKAAEAADAHGTTMDAVARDPEMVPGLNASQRDALGGLGSLFERLRVPAFQQLHALLQANPVGTPWLVKLDWLMGSRADAARPWNWYSQRAAGGGVLGSLGTHAFDTLHWLLGPTRSLSASRSLAIPHRPLVDGSGRLAAVDAEDIALLQLELETTSGRPLPAQVSLAAVTRPGRGYWIEIYGSEGSVVLGSPNQVDYVHGFKLQQAGPGETLQELAADPQLAFPHTWPDGRVAPVRRLITWWAQAAREGRPMVPGLAEAALSQRVCDLALVSADTGLRQSL